MLLCLLYPPDLVLAALAQCHDLSLLLFSGVGMGDVLGGHHPCFEVVNCFLGEAHGGSFFVHVLVG
jgi:hypothetical protein